MDEFDGFRSDIEDAERDIYEHHTGRGNMMSAMAGELVKSYGFHYDADKGTWDWSLANIGKAFKDSPFWTTLDYLSLTAAPARFGLAATSIARGWEAAGTIGKAFEAGEFAKARYLAPGGSSLTDRPLRSLLGKLATRTGLMSDELARATEMKIAGPGLLHGVNVPFYTKKTGRTLGIANPLTTQVDQDFMDLAAAHGGGTVWERRAIAASQKREMLMQSATKSYEADRLATRMERSGLSAGRQLDEPLRYKTVTGGVQVETRTRGMQERFMSMLGGKKYAGVAPPLQPEADGSIRGAWGEVMPQSRWIPGMSGPRPIYKTGQRLFEKSPEAADVYAKTWEMRNQVHDNGYLLGLFSKNTWLRNAMRWNPAVYEQWHKINEALDEISPGTRKIPGRFVPPDDPMALREGVLSFEQANQRGRIRNLPELRGTSTPSPQLVEHLKTQGYKAPRQDENGHWVWAAVKRKNPNAATMRETGAEAHYLKAGEKEPEYLTNIMSPRAKLSAIARASQLVSQQAFAQGIANSVLAQDASSIAMRVAEIVNKQDYKLALLHGITSAKLDKTLELVKDLNAGNREVRGEILAQHLGWMQVDSLYKDIPGYLARLPEELRNKFIDPSVAADIKGALNVFGKDTPFWDFYKQSLNVFRASKTAYNPATHVRNIFGAAIFSHLATGGPMSMVPVRAIKALWKGSPELNHAAEAGVFGTAFDLRATQDLVTGANIEARTALDWIPESTTNKYLGAAARGVKTAARGSEWFYRKVDEVYKLDAWLRNVDKYSKVHPPELARSLSTVEMNKFMPSFLVQSELEKGLSQAVPFAGFSVQAMRVWKNALMEKPHLVYFWNHFAKSMSQTFAGLAGYSPSQLDAAQAALPSHLQDKKALLLPFNVDGQPQFLDLSYIIPMGNISEVERSERAFFGLQDIIDPTTNPWINIPAAAATGKDPFGGHDIEPSFTEQQLGIPVQGAAARKTIGMGEHMLRQFLPPWTPPGYAGTNIMEWARGQRNPNTGEKLEDGAWRTAAANIMGMRGYSPDVESQVKNTQEEERQTGTQVSDAWKRWEFARAQGDVYAMEQERERIVALRGTLKDDDPEGYFVGSAKRRSPFSDLSTRQLEEILGRAEKLGDLSPRDERIRAELLARYQTRGRRSKRRRVNRDTTNEELMNGFATTAAGQ